VRKWRTTRRLWAALDGVLERVQHHGLAGELAVDRTPTEGLAVGVSAINDETIGYVGY